ncbi:MAG TPA: GNAT family N-acetyltransferase [Gaiellaceae bacterium]|nr:GNAT family N-acetyltransferase [Gaiellaceae bacterium]
MRARELTVEEAERPLGWRYAEPYETYDAEGPLGRDLGYFAVETEDGELVGFGCVGAEARVPGVDEEPGTVDVGYGMRPDLVGQGLGREFVGVVLAHVASEHPAARLRMSIYRWNARSRRVAEAHGFHVAGDAGEFDVLVREPPQTGGGAEYRHG